MKLCKSSLITSQMTLFCDVLLQWIAKMQVIERRKPYYNFIDSCDKEVTKKEYAATVNTTNQAV